MTGITCRAGVLIFTVHIAKSNLSTLGFYCVIFLSVVKYPISDAVIDGNGFIKLRITVGRKSKRAGIRYVIKPCVGAQQIFVFAVVCVI